MDNQLEKALKNSLVELPFSDFDQRMMQEIRKEAIVLEKTKKDRNIASLFFMLGCFFGMCCAGLAAFSKEVSGMDLKTVWQAATVILGFLFINSFYTIVYKKIARNTLTNF
ncbi:hypothetical protein WG904_18855 [Pedobacter sp. Du54]|uniref:hypothetical protein n=1 Tax=Pedobacter anseongensis TaxID=3133439 RepID=UPI0030B14F44